MMSLPTVKELVLLGGGHSHVEVLRSWGIQPLAGVRLTLVTRDMHTPYSGMLPGYVSGFYSYDDCHIDLSRLATFANARLIHAEANGIDTKARRVLFPSRPPVRYDVLSVDVGITPAATCIPGAAAYTTPVKPIDKFVGRFDALLARIRASAKPLTLVVVGGGAGGVELALALAYRVKQERAAAAAAAGQAPARDKAGQSSDVVKLFCRGSILQGHPAAAAAAVRSQCTKLGVLLHEGAAVERVEPGLLFTCDGQQHAFDEGLWCTQAAAAAWLKQTGLPTDASGFLSVSATLQSAGGPPEVFAAGDVASSVSHPRPKAGVYAVRQGPPLAANLRCYLSGRPLQPFVPQSQALALISTGDRYAVGTRGWLTFQGAWAWKLKDHIDRAFMEKYGANLPFEQAMGMADSSSSSSSWLGWMGGGWMNLGHSGTAASAGSHDRQAVGPSQQQQQQLPGAFAASGAEGAELFAAAKMRCGGCGAKVGSSTLSRVLQRIKTQQQQQQQQQQGLLSAPSPSVPAAAAAVGDPPHSTAGNPAASIPALQPIPQLQLGADDAAVLAPPPPGHLLVTTVDFFKAFWPDAYMLGKIAANHALGDCYAMGAVPSTAQALAVVPYGSAAYQEAELGDMLTGAVEVLSAAGCELVGGHSSEGSELAAGFTITGHVHPDLLLTKAGLKPGQALVLTKALGTGSILAAAMRGKAKGRWISSCLAAMAVSSGGAAGVLQGHGCTAATDVTGFGLLGHAVEMARASRVKLELSLAHLPALPGAADCIAQGTLSSLHPSNEKAAAAVVENYEHVSADARYILACDPQTAGGLLGGVPFEQADACVASLRRAGYRDACVVGRVASEVQIENDESSTVPLVQFLK